MGDVKQPSEKQSDEKESDDKHSGKFHYNPVNMSDKEAGIKEHDEDASKETSRKDVDADTPVMVALEAVVVPAAVMVRAALFTVSVPLVKPKL